jgi:hypothetical protein
MNILALITPPNLHIASPLAILKLKTKLKTKNKKINPAFVGCTIAFSVYNRPFKPLRIP